jgi:hypothetical protein
VWAVRLAAVSVSDGARPPRLLLSCRHGLVAWSVRTPNCEAATKQAADQRLYCRLATKSCPQPAAHELIYCILQQLSLQALSSADIPKGCRRRHAGCSGVGWARTECANPSAPL